MKFHWKDEEGKWVEVEPGIKRKQVAYGSKMLMAYFRFEKGSGSLENFHSHKHAQVTYIISGKFIFNVDGQEIKVGPGDSLYNPENKPHTAICAEKGELIDVFSPCRKEFINE